MVLDINGSHYPATHDELFAMLNPTASEILTIKNVSQ